MKKALIALFLPIIGCANDDSEYWNRTIKMTAERGYFEGQRDAIKGDIRIKSDSPYTWLKSPWADNRPIDYRIDTICSKRSHLYY